MARKVRNLEDSGIDDALLELVKSAIAIEPIDPFKNEDLERALAILKASKPDCIRYFELRFVLSMSYREMSETLGLKDEDAARYKVKDCLDRVRRLFP